MYFGSEAGFMTGALSAVISNFFFGQGPWTPFQMFSWGILGLIAGIIADPLKRSKIVLTIYAVISGILYSLIMDIWTVLWADGYFNFSRYLCSRHIRDTIYGNLCSIECSISFAVLKAYRKNIRKNEGKIRILKTIYFPILQYSAPRQELF